MDIDKELNIISDNIEKMDKYTNIVKINKKHKQIKQSLNTIFETVNTLKDTFENETSYSEKNITDEEYELYMKELDNFNIDDLDLSEQINKYKYFTNIIYMITKYMNSKKMEKIFCDDK